MTPRWLRGDVVEELRALHASGGNRFMPEVERIGERGAEEIERLRSGLLEIVKMGEGLLNRQTVRARVVYVGDVIIKVGEGPFNPEEGGL